MREGESNEIEIEGMKDDQFFSTDAAWRKAISRAKKHLPNHPSKFATVIEGIISRSTPRRKKALSRVCLTPSKRKRLDFLETGMSSVNYEIRRLKTSNERKNTMRRRQLVHVVAGNLLKKYKKYQVSKEIGIRWATMVKWSTEGVDVERKQRSDALRSEVVKKVKDFYVQPHISVTHAEKKSVSKTLLQRHTLNQSKQETFKRFKEECSDVKISETKFWSLKPKSVVPLRKGRFRSCLCEKCVNVELKLKALNNKFQSGINDKYQLNKTSLCKYESGTEARLECIRRQCNSCGPEKLHEHLDAQIIESSDQMVQWNRWENTKIDGKQRKMLASHHSTVRDLIAEIEKDLQTLPAHLFDASWQYRQFANLKSNLPNGNMLCVMDFAENFTVRQQDECQSAHWFAQQVTIHPIVCYYHQEEQSELVTHELVHISADLLHDSHFVHRCFKDSVNYLEDQGKSFDKIIQFTDGCSAQYKSKTPFMDLSCAEEDFNVKIERNFFGSGHGKGPADGCSGVVKSAVHRAMVAGTVINSAQDFFDYCKTHLTKDESNFKRTFHFVQGVDRTRPDRTSAKTLEGTRKLHSVRGVSRGLLEVRSYTCTCPTCLNPGHGRCVNDAYVESWRVCDITVKKKKDQKMKKADEKRKSKDKEKMTSSNKKKRDEVNKRKDKENLTDQEKIGDEDRGSSVQEIVTGRKRQKRDKLEESTDKEKASGHLKKPTEEVVESTEKEDSANQHSSLWVELQSCKTFEEIQDKVVTCLDCFPLQKLKKVTFVSCGGVIDNNALGLVPDDLCIESQALYPAIVYGDGNCLPRAASVLCYGTEERHLEMRARIIKELVENEDKYLSDFHMSQGTTCTSNSCTQHGIVKQFALFSEQFSGEKLTPLAIRRIYRAEVLSLCQSGSYMGIWQVAAISNVLQTKVFSVYPKYGGQTVRKDLHRTFQPFDEKSRNDPVYILWTNTRGINIPEREWRPNHFVPLLHTYDQNDSSSDIDLSDSSNNNIDISDIIQSLEEFSDSPVQLKKLNSVIVGPDQNFRYLKILKL